MKKNEAKYKIFVKPEATVDVLEISNVMIQDMRGKRYASFPGHSYFVGSGVVSFANIPFLLYAQESKITTSTWTP